MSKQATIFQVMNDNADKPMDEVLQIIVEATAHMPGKAIDLRRAKAYYVDAVKKGHAPGKIEKSVRAAPVNTPTVKTNKPKLVSVPKPKVQGDKPVIADKTVEEIEDIKAKNMARLKAVGEKFMKGQVAEGKKGSFNKAQAKAAKQYVVDVTNDLDSFKVPEFLTADEVKALV